MSQNNPTSTSEQDDYVFVERPADSKPRVFYNTTPSTASANAQERSYICERPGFVIEGSMLATPEQYNEARHTIVLQFNQTADGMTDIDSRIEHTLAPRPIYLNSTQLQQVKDLMKWIRLDKRQEQTFRFDDSDMDDGDKALFKARCDYAIRILQGALQQHRVAVGFWERAGQMEADISNIMDILSIEDVKQSDEILDQLFESLTI
jgi:hypothetical protein